MKKIIIKSIKFSEFKGSGKTKEIKFNQSDRNKIYGKNGSGKTTIIEAITFTLFGKGLFGEKIKSEPMENGKIKSDYETKLDLKLSILENGIEKDFEISKKIRNNSLIEMKINDKLFKKLRDFNESIESILGVDERQFMILSNPKYFSTISGNESRTLILSLTSSNNEFEINDEHFYHAQIKLNISKGISLQEQKEFKESEIKNIKDDIQNSTITFESKKETLAKITGIESNINVNELLVKKAKISEEIKKCQIYNNEILQKKSEYQNLQNQLIYNNRDREYNVKRLAERDELIKNIDQEINNLSMDFKKLESQPISDICFICGSKSSKEYEKNNQKKQESLKQISKKADELRLKKEKLLAENIKSIIENLDVKGREINEEIEKWKFISDEKDIQKLNEEFEKITSAIGNSESIKIINKDISFLKSDIIFKKTKLNKLEDEFNAIITLIKNHAKKIENQINQNLEFVKVKLFEIFKNGSVKNIFTIEKGGIDFARMNSADQINSGIALLNYIQKAKDICLPIFVDNAESVTSLQPTNSQTFEMYVKNGETIFNE